MYKKILLPFDGSSSSYKALDAACDLSKRFNSKLIVTYVVEFVQLNLVSTGYLNSEEINEKNKQLGEEVLLKAKKILLEKGIEADYQLLISNGEKIGIILVDFIKKNDFDLVIMGTHGYSGVMHLLLGSVATTVLRNTSNLPIMLFK